MSWIKVREFYGLEKPFNFNVAIPFLLNTFMLIVVVVVCIFLFMNGGLSIGTARFYFFCYIACLLVIAAAFSKARKFSYVILCWCIVELGLALGGHILREHGVRAFFSLCPRDISARDPWSTAFIYHPLLQSVPRPNFQFKLHPDIPDPADKAKAKAAGIDISSLQDQELSFYHNSLGIRRKELTQDDLTKDLIFAYGGSTTYDIGVTQGETWVDHLQSQLGSKYTILNLGIPGHSTAEHLIETAFYQDIVKKKPVCAIYYVGWNDIANVHIEHLDSGYADYHMLVMAERQPDLFMAKFSPLVFLANQIAKKRFDTVPQPLQLLGKTPISGSDEHLEAIFAEHIKTIASINEARGIKTIFIGQMVNRSWPDGPNEFQPLIGERDFVPLVERINSIGRAVTASMPAKYIDPGIANFTGSDFVDTGHFAASGAKKFAMLISREVGDYCR